MAVTFTRQTHTRDPETDVATVSASTVVGNAVRVRGDPHRYRNLGLVESRAPTLIFTPTTYGEFPEPGDTLTWESATYTVRDVQPVAPDGIVIAARVIVEKG